MTPTQDPSPEGESGDEEQVRAGIDSWRERQYAAARKRAAKLTPNQIDDRLNLMECDHVLRDEIVERLARLEACEAALRPFAEAWRHRPDAPATIEHCARAAELVPEEK